MMTTAGPANNEARENGLHCFQGQASDVEAFIYAELTSEHEEGCRLEGTVEGPYCRTAHTLKASIPFQSAAPGDSLLASVAIPDPCFWTPHAPHLYRANLQLRLGANVLQSWQIELGLRQFGVHRGDFMWARRRWVWRGIWYDDRWDAARIDASSLDACRTVEVACAVPTPDEITCRHASESGVVLMAAVASESPTRAATLRRLSRWPAVAAICLTGSSRHTPPPMARNVPIGQHVLSSEPFFQADWAEFIVYEIDNGGELECVDDCPLPVVVLRRMTSSAVKIEAARQQCDALQRDLATIGDYSGYLV